MKRKRTLFLAGIFVIFGLIGSASYLGGDVTLDVPECIQEYSNWCWNGSSQSVLYFFGPTPSQCEIANFAWKRSDCCGNHPFSWYHPCNSGNYLYGHRGSCKDVLTNWGVGSSGSNGALSWNTVKGEIDGGSPFIMGWYWTGGGGHALVGHGYSVKNGTDYLSYMDPWPGEGFATSTYSYVVAASDHQWGQTLTTN